MSLVMRAQDLALKFLPPATAKKLQELKQRLPLRMRQAHPVVQIYINDAQTRSYVGIHNFYSYLLADIDSHATAQLSFYNPAGNLVATHVMALPHFAARSIDVKAVLDAKNVTSPYGVVTVQLTPRWPRRRAYRDLGLSSAHFFVFFRDAQTGSVEQTHPLSTTDPANRPYGPFVSSQIISTAKLEQIVIFQYNPSTRTHTLEHQLVDLDTDDKVAGVSHSIAPLGSARSVFTLSELATTPAALLFVVDALPSGNAKPMLRRVYAGGQHSMSHA